MSDPEETLEPRERPAAAADRPAAESGESPEQQPRLARGYARGRAADDAARARLEPLARGERPLAVTVCAVLAGLVGLANIGLALSGWELSGVEQPSMVEALALPVIMLVLAVGMWQRHYWALIAFQALLTLTIIVSFLMLLSATNLEAMLLSVGVLAVSGVLFWFLVKAMARTQMPRDTTR